LSKSDDDLPYSSPTTARARAPLPYGDNGILIPDGEGKGAAKDDDKAKGKGKGKKWKLEEVERWTMVKRIW